MIDWEPDEKVIKIVDKLAMKSKEVSAEDLKYMIE
jgi:hypothetical protein